ncbi:MAG: T9SS type A sorting domain-containing protein [Bacteroidetes bacterium]|nr:T9SS type A sorting domain-containing protein [Bacteroidota bacterium]
MKFIRFILLIIFILFNIYNSKSQVDTNYVKPEELENGWYTTYGNNFFWDPSPLKTYVDNISVSKDGKWLTYRSTGINDINNNYGIWIYNINNKTKMKLNFSNISLWWGILLQLGNDNLTLRFRGNNNFVYFYNVETMALDSVDCPTDSENCSFGLIWAPDNYAYFSYPYGIPSPDSSMYRENIMLSKQFGHPVSEKINDVKYGTLNIPYFPPDNINFFVRPKGSCTQESPSALCGFKITREFIFSDENEVFLVIPDKDWIYSYLHTNRVGDYPPLKVSTDGCIYIYLSYRNQREYYSSTDDPFDSINRIARDASGWYRVDTTGNNLIQLVRSWIVYTTGLSVTGDGETIYYAQLLPDTTTGIMRMNKYGKNKELVLKIEPETIGVVDNKLVSNKFEAMPNPASTLLDIVFSLQNKGTAQLIITNSFGQQVYNAIVNYNDASNEQRHSIDISTFPSGLYFVTLRSPAVALTQGVVVIK